jgi:signal transduction histidine kinase/ActR/RegA family two-component response regulator
VGEGWANALHPDDVERTQQRWQRSLRTGEIYDVEYRLRRFDGTFRWFLGRAMPQRDTDGTILRWFGTCTDIEEQKRAQREKAAALEREAASRREAEAANRIKDEFLAVVSHELRTPLTPILGWTNLLKGGDDDPVLRRQGIETIERNAKAQSQIINDLLDVSRIISGKLKLDVKPITLQSVIEAAIETVEPAAQARGVQIISHFDEAGRIMGDSDRLQQVMWNLLANAIKFTPRHGRVEVRLHRFESMMEVEVQDSGQGIESEFLPLVFERFRQADASSTRSHGGLGLGLSIVRYLVEQHGGEVAVASPGPNQGSTFTIRLPLAPVLPEVESELMDVPSHSEAFAASRSALEGVKILAVDDEVDARDVLEKTLQRYGATVRTAASAQQAFQLFQEEVPDLLLSDIGMPEEDGYTLIQRVRALPAEQGGRVPALALTAYARAEDRARALRSGYQNHVAKPVAPAELVVTLAALLGRPMGK